MYRATSYLSLIFGGLAALSIISAQFLFIGLICSILGFAASIFNIFVQTKYQMEKRLLTKAHLGLLLSSVPVLYMIILVLIFKA